MTFVTRRLLPSGQVQQHRMLETVVAFGGAPSRFHLVSAGRTDSGVVVSRVRVGEESQDKRRSLSALDIRRLLVVALLCPDSV